MTTFLRKSCSFGFPRVPFVNCRQFMYLVISLLVLRAGCGIWLYQFLIIAYHFTFHGSLGDDREAVLRLKVPGSNSTMIFPLSLSLFCHFFMLFILLLRDNGHCWWKSWYVITSSVRPFSHIVQEYPFLWLSEIFLSRAACLILGYNYCLKQSIIDIYWWSGSTSTI